MIRYQLLNNNFYILRYNYIYFLYIIKNNLMFVINYKNICLNLDYLSFSTLRYTKNILNVFFFSWNNYILRKVKFKHKITWLYIYRTNLQFLKISTNLSTKIFFIVDNFRLKRKKNHFSSHSLVFWGTDYLKLNILLNSLINLLYFNSYTHKGFKLARAKLIHRVGKVSRYKGLKGKVF